jgi:enoyl-CoA hydratase/carnithine racemase
MCSTSTADRWCARDTRDARDARGTAGTGDAGGADRPVSTPDDHRIELEFLDQVLVVAFDRPEARNAFDTAMYRAVTGALSGALEDDDVHAVVLTGRGTAFTSGQDLREMVAIATGDAPAGAGLGFRDLLDLLQRFDKPLLAAVNGVGMGLGCSILGHVDLVLIDEHARLRVPFAEMGVPPEAGSSVLLPARMGWQQASAALLASAWISAESAVASGLALRSCPEGTVVAETLELARTVASFPSHATRQIKRLMLAGRGASVTEARGREEAAFAALFADPSVNPGTGLAAGLGG